LIYSKQLVLLYSPQVGLPAKSGVSGALVVVVPNVMGIGLWSPALDEVGNSVRGLQFCQVQIFDANTATIL
jgi:glutaminase